MSASQHGDVTVRVSARTDVGMIRRGNEDCFLIADLSTGNTGLTPEVSKHHLGDLGSLLVVSDGMGGAVAGEIASDLAVNGVRDEMVRATQEPSLPDRLRAAVESANRLVWQHAQDNPHLAGMGATLTAVLVHGRNVYIGQVGDSRAYLIRGGRIKQLTKDQSLVQLLMDAKAIRPEQVNQVPNNVILQALGTRPEVVVAMSSVDLCAGDVLLLCSDGLSNKIMSDEIRDIAVQCGSDLAAMCRRLIELANARGGEDNITTLIAQFDGTSLRSLSESTSITGSLTELSSNDLLRIGGAQLDFYQDPASDFTPPQQDVNAVLDDLGVTLLPTQPNAAAERDDDKPITQVAIPVLHQQRATPYVAVAPAFGTPVFPTPTRKADSKSVAQKLMLAIGLMLVGLGVLLGIAFVVYFVIVSRGAQ